MKWNLSLSDRENLDRLRGEKTRRIESDKQTRYTDLTPEEKAFCLRINEELKRIEAHVHREVLRIEAELKPRIADPDDWLQDYEIELKLAFILVESDPDYDENDDNVLVVLRDAFKNEPEKPDFGVGALDTNHAELHEWFEGEMHCWLYHDLYDHRHLDWRDLLRIDDIWVDLKVYHQHFVSQLHARGQPPYARHAEPDGEC